MQTIKTSDITFIKQDEPSGNGYSVLMEIDGAVRSVNFLAILDAIDRVYGDTLEHWCGEDYISDTACDRLDEAHEHHALKAEPISA